MTTTVKEYTYSYKMDTKSENPPVRTFDLNSDPINVFMSPKLAQSFGTVSYKPKDIKTSL